jgi:hypothetical protein
MQDFFYNGVWRMDWGLGNPNKTAALIATLMVGVWTLSYIQRWGYWLALVLFTGLGIGLIHTFSRGGLIAFFFGIAPIIYFADRPWPRAKVIGITASVCVIVCATIFLDAQDRYVQGLVREDRSIINRLEIWKAAPQMMVDAPDGWGIGKSGQAYIEWYQPPDRSEKYRTLVNSHLTWLVEVGWPLRFLYVFAWVSILLLCWPNGSLRALSIPMGIWIAFAIAAIFSSVAESPWLWGLPLIGLVLAILLRARRRAWPKLSAWSIPCGASILTMVTFIALGQGGKPVRVQKGYLLLGKAPPQIWIFIDKQVMGENYGHTIRRYLSSTAVASSIGVIESLTVLPELEDKTVVVGGLIPKDDRVKSALISAKQIILLNPCFFPQEIDATTDRKDSVRVVFGEFSQSLAANAWGNIASVERVAGVGDFLPRWPELALSKK